jgi:hypothetical protein
MFEETIVVGSFRPAGKSGIVEYNTKGGTSGITRMKIWPDGRFEVTARNIDLHSINQSFVSFVLHIGDRVQGMGIEFDANGLYIPGD